jgi:hypothetical protein
LYLTRLNNCERLIYCLQSNNYKFWKAQNTPWPGNISLSKLLKTGGTCPNDIASIIHNIEKYFVDVNINAKTRCIDGRFDPNFDSANLGPQVPGGSIGATLAYRLSAGRHTMQKANFRDDSKTMLKILKSNNLHPGGHRDNHSDGISSAGCGAIDKMNLAVEYLSNKDFASSIYDLSKALIGQSFNDDNFFQILGTATILNCRSDKYFGNRIEAFKVLDGQQKNSITTLQGEHKECLVIANYVKGTTLAENNLLNDYNGLQVFNYDVWRTLDLADKIFPNKKDRQDKSLFIMARAMTAIATLMCLTDGSQTLLTRK